VESNNWRITVQAAGTKSKISKRAGDMAQTVEHLPSKSKVLSPNPSFIYIRIQIRMTKGLVSLYSTAPKSILKIVIRTRVNKGNAQLCLCHLLLLLLIAPPLPLLGFFLFLKVLMCVE
jgi:hypothetical protein